jgi:transposase
MPAKNHLSKEQRERLLKNLKEQENPYVREKILILLLMNDGKTYQEISNFLDIAYPTVAYWAVHGDPDNLESFLDGRREGNFRKVTKEYEDLLLKVIEKEPEEYGYEFGRWTAARLATFINPERLQVWFWDESGFSLRVIRRKTWVRKGNRKNVTGQRRRGRVNIMGGLRYHDKKRINFVIKKGNADVFYEQLKSLNDFLIQEWIEKGNSIENFHNNSAKIVIILDNASFHKRKDILARIEAEMPNIILEFLPPYSPDYNLIELVWHSAKEYIAHRLFESVSQLEELLNKLLNEGGLIIKWERKIKNKGNAVYSI